MKNISKINEGTLWGKSFNRGMGDGVVRRKEDEVAEVIERIEEFMKRHHMKSTYTINDDYSVDIDGTFADIEKDDLIDGKLPFKFGKVRSFECIGVGLVSLDGCPREVGGPFNCSENMLESLDGAPAVVKGFFQCDDSGLKSLEGCPEEVGGTFSCCYNELENLDGCPRKVGGNFYCRGNKVKFKEDYIRSLCDVKGSIYC